MIQRNLPKGVLILFGIISAVLILIGIGYCYNGMSLRIAKFGLFNFLREEQILAVVWWSLAGFFGEAAIWNKLARKIY